MLSILMDSIHNIHLIQVLGYIIVVLTLAFVMNKFNKGYRL